jgi:hypothetical protein
MAVGLRSTCTYTKTYRNIKLEYGNIATNYTPNSADTLYNTLGYGDTTIYDVSGYCNNGTNVGCIVDTDSLLYNTSCKLNDSSDYVNITPCFSAGQTVPTITVSIWFKTDTLNNTNPNLFSLGQNSFLRARIASATSLWTYKIVGSTAKGNTFTATNVTSVIDNTWHLYTYVFNNGIEKNYLDGTLINTTDYTDVATYLTCSSTSFILGGYSTGSEKYIGSLSDFRIYTTALSDSDILALYNKRFSIDVDMNVYASELIED